LDDGAVALYGDTIPCRMAGVITSTRIDIKTYTGLYPQTLERRLRLRFGEDVGRHEGGRNGV